jgi:hypothetical protein
LCGFGKEEKYVERIAMVGVLRADCKQAADTQTALFPTSQSRTNGHSALLGSPTTNAKR